MDTFRYLQDQLCEETNKIYKNAMYKIREKNIKNIF
jgi:hypothetical protein